MIVFKNKEKNNGYRNIPYDVSITYSIAHGGSEKVLRYSFSEKAVRMICGDGFFAVAGIDARYPDRIYFCVSNSRDGYKLSKSGTNTRYATVFSPYLNYNKPTDFIGLYNLEYDAIQNAFYIDKKRKKEGAENE